MAIGDFVKGVIVDVLEDMLRKSSTSKRAKRRKRSKELTIAETLRQLQGKTRKPARKQTSRRKTVKARSKAKKRA